MSTEPNCKNINKIEKEEKNDWNDDDDDDWDDWGDAEDNFEDARDTSATESNSVKAAVESNSANDKPTRLAMEGDNYNVENSKSEKHATNTEITKPPSPEEPPQAVATQRQATTAGWGGLFGGVVSSVLSTASDLSTTVTHGLNQVIGVPDPEELARIQAAESAKMEEDKSVTERRAQMQRSQAHYRQEADGTPAFGLSIVSGVTSLGTKVLNTGLDTLEGIGKKTMHILQENDPLLMNKRKLLGLEADRPNLSEVLKEAKKDADTLEHTLKELKLEKSRDMLRFDLLFENHCGLAHLEALEILSKESTLKLQKLQDAVSGKALIELKETIDEVKELMEMEDIEGESDGQYDGKELNERLLVAMEDVDLPINFDDLVDQWTIALKWLETKETTATTPTATDNTTNDIMHETFACALTTLAEACALEMCKLHKMAELLLVADHHSTANEVDCIVQLCKQFNIHLNGLTNRFAAALNNIAMPSDDAAAVDEMIKSRVSTLFAEMLVAMQQIEKAFHLFLPILQMGVV